MGRWLIGAAFWLGPVVSAALADPITLPPPDGASETASEVLRSDTYALPIAAFGGDLPATETVSGEVLRAAWRVDGSGGATFASVLDIYRKNLRAAGYQRLLDCERRACGGFDFRIEADLIPPPEMRMDVAHFGQLTMGRKHPSGFVSILASEVLGDVFVQVVTVRPQARTVTLPVEPLDAPLEEQQAPVPNEDEEVQRSLPRRAAARPLIDRLLEFGHVAVGGLIFETGGSALTWQSGEALDEMAEMLSANQDLRVAIVGHSDNVGSLDGNITLSRRRADAVRTALIERGVEPDRLEARGVGYLAPIRSNAKEEGRALNRRVELVLR
ncbi:MAG: OmpA family protein [Pseudomonadota bacterium]